MSKRSAFTLTELLVVIALIVVLGALGMGAATKGWGWMKQRSTETTMTKVIERIVHRRINDIRKHAQEWDSTPPIIYNQAGGNAQRAETLKLLYLYKWSFPQTYAEAWYNLQESKVLYDQTGYVNALTTWNWLSATIPAGVTRAQFIATPAANEMSRAMQYQASACLLASLGTTRASSIDELGTHEFEIMDEASGKYDLSNALPAGSRASGNRYLVDAWGTPLFFLRHGNFWDNLGARASLNRQPFWCGLVNPPVAPIPAVLGNGYYDILVNGRAGQAFTSTWNRDPFDHEGVLRNTDAWRRIQIAANDPLPWLNSGANPPYRTTHLAPPGGREHADYFRSNMGYWPQDGLNPLWPQEFAPLVIISAGGDRLFTTWDDNLDSYRLKISVSGQQ
jgi:prepilin-type N-terminal cleavage/methylation domain-containing protein